MTDAEVGSLARPGRGAREMRLAAVGESELARRDPPSRELTQRTQCEPHTGERRGSSGRVCGDLETLRVREPRGKSARVCLRPLTAQVRVI